MSNKHSPVYHRQQQLDYVSLRDPLHSSTPQRPQVDPIIDRLEQAQNEVTRLKKAYDDIVEKRNHLKVECRMHIHAMCVADRRNEMLQNQLSTIMKNSNAKEISRLQSERDTAVHDYNLVMQERDSVHKEIERLQDDLKESQRTCSILETEKRMSLSEIQTLKERLDQTSKERNRLAINCHELRKQVNNLMSILSSSSSNYNHQPSSQQVPGQPVSLQRNFQTLGQSTLTDNRCRYYNSSTSSPSNYSARLNSYTPLPLSSLSASRFNNLTWQSPTKDTIGAITHLNGGDRSTTASASDTGETNLQSNDILSNSIYDNHRLTSHQTSLYHETPYASKFARPNLEPIKQQHHQQLSQSPYSSLCAYGSTSRSTAASLAESINHVRLSGSGGGASDKSVGGNGQQSLMQSNDFNSRDMKLLLMRIEDLSHRLTEAQLDAGRLAKNREVAMIERDKLISERNSIRLLCDRLRRERDGAVNKLAEALHDSNNVRLLMAEQRKENMKELRDLQESYDVVQHDHHLDTLSSDTSISNTNQYNNSRHHQYHHQNNRRRVAKNCKLFASQQIPSNNRQSSLSPMMAQSRYHGVSMESDSNSCGIVSISTNAMNLAINQIQKLSIDSINNSTHNSTNNTLSNRCPVTNGAMSTTPLSTPTSTGGFNFNPNYHPNSFQKPQSRKSQEMFNLATPPSTLNKSCYNLQAIDLKVAQMWANQQQQEASQSINNNFQNNASSSNNTISHAAIRDNASAGTKSNVGTTTATNTTKCVTSHESAVDADFSFELPVIKLKNEIKRKKANGVCGSMHHKDQQPNQPGNEVYSSSKPYSVNNNNTLNNNYQESTSSSEQITTDSNNSENSLLKYGFELSDTSESGVKGIFVSSVRKGSQVEQFLEVGDQLLDVNGVNLRQPECDLKTTEKLFSYYYQKENPIRVACRRRTLPTDAGQNITCEQLSSLATQTKVATNSQTTKVAITSNPTTSE